MNGKDFLAFASKIVVLHSQPAATRSAISRAYYGAFHTAVKLLRDQSLTTDATHGSVWMDFLSASEDEAQFIGNSLQELHSFRVKADYLLERTDVEQVKLAMICIETAERVVLAVKTLTELLRDSELQTQFTQAILNHRKLTGRR